MRIIQDLKIRNKMLLIALSSLAVIITLAIIMLLSLRTSLMEEKRQQVRNVVEIAHGTIKYYHGLAESGAMTQEAARSASIAAIKALRYNEKEYFWINDMKPLMIMHPIKPELDGKDLSDMKDPNGKRLFVEFADTVRKQKEGFVDYLWPMPGHDAPVPKISYVKGFEPWGWVIGSGIYVDNVAAAFWEKVGGLALTASLLVAVVGGIIGYITWYVIKDLIFQMQKNVEVLDRIGNGDISVNIASDREDEFGDMSKSMNAMITNLRRTVTGISGTTSNLAASSEELSATSDGLNKGSQQLASQIEQVVTAMTEVSQTIMDMAKNASQSAEASKDVSSTAAIGKEIVDTTAADMATIAATVQEAATTIEELGKSSAQIGEIVATINGIADQTNLLALNAAIEAARAGDQGRGFAVVADEVRKLAERTSQATKDISSRISGIQRAAAESVEAMKKGSDQADKGVGLAREASVALESIVSASTNAMDMVQRIAAATEEQSATSEEVSQNMEHISQITKSSSASTEQVKVSAAELAKLASGLKEITAWFKV